ncbi:MAG: inner-rane translocator [Chloroflexi bacterium]|nr:inner-rane translocator [Chloroflexota bacterium]
MNSFLVELLAGLSTGGIYALLALGLTLVFQVSGVVNFAQGALAASGAYILWSLLNQANLPFWIALVMTVCGTFLIGAMLQVLILQRLERAQAASVIVTLGLLIVIEGLLGWHWGYQSPTVNGFAQPLSLPLPTGSWSVGGANVSYLDVASIGVAVTLIALFFAFLRLTKAGTAVLAVAQNAQGARLVGIHVQRVRLIAWGVGAVIAAAAGVLIPTAKFVPMNPTMVEPYLLNAFAGAVMGGLDSLVGAAIGALVIGVIQNLVAFYLPSTWSSWGMNKDAVVFIMLLAVLMVRPAGVFGTAVQRRV